MLDHILIVGADDTTTTPIVLLILATHLLTSTLVCGVEVWSMKDWPVESINKNLPGYFGFGVIGESHPFSSSGVFME